MDERIFEKLYVWHKYEQFFHLHTQNGKTKFQKQEKKTLKTLNECDF